VNLVEALKNRKVQLGIAVVAILLAVALTLVWVLQPKNDNPLPLGNILPVLNRKVESVPYSRIKICYSLPYMKIKDVSLQRTLNLS